MQELTAEGRRIIDEVAARHGVSQDAARALAAALAAGGGGQAQFNIHELGGMGQWSRGGMTMVGDMFNHGLKARVDALASELAERMGGTAFYAPYQTQRQGQGDGVSLFVDGGGGRWPPGLGQPASSGAQNDLRYAVFPQARRLAIERRGRVTVYDTGDHAIGGVAQAQSGDQSLSFTSQHGLVRVADLAEVEAEGEAPAGPTPGAAAPSPRAGEDVFGAIERLAELHGKGVLTDAEFEAKKAELLARL